MNVLATKTFDFKTPYSVKDYKFSVDWLNVRIEYDNPIVFIESLCHLFPCLTTDDFTRRDHGVCYYPNAFYCNLCGYSGFTINWNEDQYGNVINDNTVRTPHGILLSISGDGCRFLNSLETDGLKKFVRFLGDNFVCHCSRIDMACDILDPENPIVPMIQTFGAYAINNDRENCPVDLNCGLRRVTKDGKSLGFCTVDLVNDPTTNRATSNVTIGSRNSTKGQLQLYNKLSEITLKGARLSSYSEQMLEAYGVPSYWYRLEYRCKSFADKVFTQLYNTESVYAAFLECAYDFGEFVKPVYTSNISTADPLPLWVEFLAFVKKLNGGVIHFVQLASLPFVKTTIARLRRHHLEDCPCSTVSAFILAQLDPHFRVELFDQAQKLLTSPRYSQLRAELLEKFGTQGLLRDFFAS